MIFAYLFTITASIFAGPENQPVRRVCVGTNHPRCILLSQNESKTDFEIETILKGRIVRTKKLFKKRNEDLSKILNKFERLDKIPENCENIIEVDNFKSGKLESVEIYCPSPARIIEYEKFVDQYS